MNTPTIIDAPPETSAAPTPLYYLHTAGEMKPAITVGQGLPTKVSGLPAFYFWKDAIAVGSYAHPAKEFKLDVTRETLDAYAANFRRMKSNGVGVPILMDHEPSAAATLGWIVDVKRDGDRLLELHQFLGEEARDVGLRNLVSLGIDPNFVDGKGTRYGQAIVHSAITPIPVVPNQGEFEPLELAIEQTGKEILTLMRPSSMGLRRAQSSRVPPMIGEAQPSRTEPQSKKDGDAGVAPTGASDSRILIDLVSMKKQLAILRGGISLHIADQLFERLVKHRDGSPNLITLSRQGDEPTSLAAAVFELLAENRPIATGERTGHQSLYALSRVAPGAGDESESSIQQRMIALANGVG